MYHFNVKRHDSFTNVIAEVTEALKTEGFGILTEIDVQATLQKKLGIERKPYIILGACNPQLAHRALEIDPNIGLLLPCNVVVSEENDGSVLVSFMDPLAVLNLVNKPEILEIAQDAYDRLKRIQTKLS
jgi:uncharacterized protein (DUF302 family)